MADWLTIQWPARRDRDGRPPRGFPDEPHGVWIQREHQAVARKIRKGDRVFVYETLTGPSLKQDGRVYSCVRGRQGVVAVGTVRTLDVNGEIQRYATGRRRLRRWSFGGSFARSVDRAGFVPRSELNEILEYSPGYVYLGFGEHRSGTGPLSVTEARAIQRAFDNGAPRALEL